MEKKKLIDEKPFQIALIICSLCVLVGSLYILFDNLFKRVEADEFSEFLDEVYIDLSREFPEKYSIQSKGHQVQIKVWADGMKQIAASAYAGNQTAIDMWTKMRRTVGSLADRLQEGARLVSDVSITLSLANDENPTRSLLVFKNRELIYDILYDKEGG